MNLCTMAQSRKDGITFYGKNYKVDMIERKDGTINYVQNKLPLIEQKANHKLSSIFLIRGLISFFKSKASAILWIMCLILQLLNPILKENSSSTQTYSNPSFILMFSLLAIIICSIIICVIILVKTFGNFNKVFYYHGTEHKIIHVLDKNLEITLENVRTQPCYHYNCGSILASFIVILLFISSFFTSHIFILFPLIYAIAFEMFSIKNGENLPFLKWFYKFGKLIQEKILTKEPSDEMILNSIEAIKILVNLEESTLH